MMGGFFIFTNYPNQDRQNEFVLVHINQFRRMYIDEGTAVFYFIRP